MAGMVQGDVQTPGICGIDLGEPSVEETLVKLQGGFAESKALTGLYQSAPTFIDRASDLDSSFQLADAQVGVQVATEHSSKDHATSSVKLLISQILDGEPDNPTKRDQCETPKVCSA